MKDVTIYFLSWQEKWVVFEDGKPTELDKIFLTDIPDSVTDDEVLEMANNRKTFLLSRLVLTPPFENIAFGSLTATATRTGTSTWKELQSAEG